MNKFTIGSVVVATLLLVGCGSNGSSSNTQASANGGVESETPTIGKGYYVDSAVAGVDYQCGNEMGTTDENGTFTFESNSSCTFTLGGVQLREINASSLEDNVTVLETNETVAQLLQTLDSDGNASNGIQIPQGSGKVIRETLQSLDDLDQDTLEAVHDRLKAEHSNEYNGRVVDRNQTMEHLNRTRAELEERGIKTDSDVAEEHRRNRENRYSPREDENRTSHNDFPISRENNNTLEDMSEHRENNSNQEQEYRGREDSNSTIEGLRGDRNSNNSQEHSGSTSTRSENRQGRN